MFRSHREKPVAVGALVALLCLIASLALPVTAATPEAPVVIRVPASAQGKGVMHAGKARVQARLVVHPDDSPGKPGQSGTKGSAFARVGVLLDIEPGWHVYWRNPGQSGLPTRIELEADGAEVEPVAWPAPQAFDEAEGLFVTYGYEGRVLFPSRLHITESASAQESVRQGGSPRPTLRAHVDLLACRSECIPGEIALERTLGEELPEAASAPAVRALFDAADAALPIDAAKLGMSIRAHVSQSAVRPGDAFQLALAVRSCAGTRTEESGACRFWAPAPGATAFFPDLVEGVEIDPATPATHAALDEGFVLLATARADDRDPGSHQALRGVLAVRDEAGRQRHVRVEAELARAPSGASVEAGGEEWLAAALASVADVGSLGLLKAIGLALLGGLILNGMPCVLPVLAIKVFSVAELARQSRSEVLAHGFAYTAGIVCSMWALAGVVAGLRAAGSLVGWGFQFQEPLFVVAICTVLVVFALNLFGVFEIGFDTGRLGGVGRSAEGARRSFFEGLLAVVLATPCTAPFLGTAVGFAFASPAAVIFAIFTAVGLGLALPFALISVVPSASRWMPRSGAWMLKLRVALGFALLASAVWLLWIAGQSLGSDSLIRVLGLFVAISFLLWLLGSLQAASRMGWARGAAIGVVAVVLAGPMLIRLEPASADPGAAADPAGESGPRPWTPEAVTAELAAGRTAFVYFTADWCITCKVNERAVIADENVQAELRRLDVAVFKADWTRRDERIRSELARFGRAGVPMYLVYAPEAPDRPTLLPELLSERGVLAALRSAAGGVELAERAGGRRSSAEGM